VEHWDVLQRFPQQAGLQLMRLSLGGIGGLERITIF
jgi:hypothetical protein